MVTKVGGQNFGYQLWGLYQTVQNDEYYGKQKNQFTTLLWFNDTVRVMKVIKTQIGPRHNGLFELWTHCSFSDNISLS